MNETNQNIKSSLNEFVTLDNPQYAIMIKGQWGCGKTYFIKEWITEIKKISKGKKKPLYLSLYGMDNLAMVRAGLNKLLHPVINSKLVKGLGKFANCATKATIKTTLPIGDNEHDVNYSLDFSSLLQTESKSNAGGKILVFDDLERCDIPIHVILGFINFFVEQCGCYVIIVCDDTKFNTSNKEVTNNQTQENGKNNFGDFKEKTIGREYLIIPSKRKALISFIKELGSDPNNLLYTNIDNIVEYLDLSRINNLRIVRQCLLDFGKIVENLDKPCFNSLRYKPVMLQLLLNMIAVYAEQKAGNAIFDSWDNLVNSFLLCDAERTAYHSLIKKYNAVPEKLGVEVLGANEIKVILWYLKGGSYPIDTIKRKLQGDSSNQNVWDKLLQFWLLSNSDFNTYYNASCDALHRNTYAYIEDLVKTMFVLVNIENKGIRTIPEGVCDEAVANYKRLMETAQDYETLCKYKNFTVGRFNYYLIENKAEKWSSFRSSCEKIFKDLLSKHKSKPAELLESLTSSNVEHLKLLQSQTAPDEQSNYEHAPMFNEIDAKLVAQNIDKLSNEAKMQFIDFLIVRYEIGMYGDESCNLCGRKEQDVDNLQFILHYLNEQQKSKKEVDAYVGNRLIEKLQIVVNEGQKRH